MSKNVSANPVTHTETNKGETDTNINKTDTGNQNVTGNQGDNVSRLDRAKNTLTRGAGKVGQGFKSVGNGVSTFATDATDYAKENPGKALAIAIGSGIAVGYLIGRTSRRQTFWTTLASAAIGAVVDRVR